jgi:hypothetical protein
MALFAIAGGLAGVGFGLYQNQRAQNQAVQNSLRAEAMLDIADENRRKTRTILEGNLTGSAMQTSANNRELAKAEFQKKAMAEANLGVSGASGGTPFYKLDADIFESARKLEEAAMMGRIQNEGSRLNVGVGVKQGDAQLQDALWRFQDAKSEENYVTGGMAQFMAAATGALQGASVSMNIESTLRQTGIIKEGIKKTSAEGADSGQAMEANAPKANTPVAPSTVNPVVSKIANPWLSNPASVDMYSTPQLINGAPPQPFSGVNTSPYMGRPPASPAPKPLNISPWSAQSPVASNPALIADTPWSITSPIAQAMGGNMKQKGMSLSGFSLTGW